MSIQYLPKSGLYASTGLNTYARLEYTKDISNATIAIIGVPWDDLATSRPGTRYGPQGIRNASSFILPNRKYNYALDINPFEVAKIVDYGDVEVHAGYIEDMFNEVEKEVKEMLKKNSSIIPVVLGGDHSISLPVIRGLSSKYKKVAVVHVDAHHDSLDILYGKKYNHGTIFRRGVEEGVIIGESSVHYGVRVFSSKEDMESVRALGYDLLTMKIIDEEGLSKTVEQLKRKVGDQPVYLSIDIDVMDPAYAPGTGYPDPGGLTSREILEFVRKLYGLNIIGMDVVEVSPPYDVAEITSTLAASIVFEGLSIISKNLKK